MEGDGCISEIGIAGDRGWLTVGLGYAGPDCDRFHSADLAGVDSVVDANSLYVSGIFFQWCGSG